MKFDTVIGNPPYNNDMYIDFVNLGFELLKDNGAEVMITPAKWQAKGGEKNEAFRQNIVPHMKKIVYYPDCNDIFLIGEPSGISFYLIDKSIHNIKDIKNICHNNKLDSHEEQSIINKTLCIKLNNIIEKMGVYKKYKLMNNKCKQFNVMIATLPALGGSSKNSNGYLLSREGSCQLLPLETVMSPDDIKEIKYRSHFTNCFCSDKKDEIESFISYIRTKFIIFGSLVGTNEVSDEAWRFVPDPGPFDHIFTDEELYKKYNLTQEEINIIESVIKERK